MYMYNLSVCLQISSSSSDTPAQEETSGGLLDSRSTTFRKALRYGYVTLGIALCLSLVYECIRCMRARQKVRHEGEKKFVTPKTSLPLPFLIRHTTCKPHSYSSRKGLHALLVTQQSSRNSRHATVVMQQSSRIIRHATLALTRSIGWVEIGLCTLMTDCYRHKPSIY